MKTAANKAPNAPPAPSAPNDPGKKEYEHLVAVPPDKGWGWVIIFVCGVGNFCIDSISLSFGLIQTPMNKELNLESAQTAWLISLLSALVYVLGPINSGLVNRFGFKPMMFTGGMIASIAFSTSFFLNNIHALFFFYSIMGAVGASFVYMTAMTCPGFWFEKKRALAMGISSCSTGFSCVTVPICADMIVKNFHWRYVFFMQGVGFFIVMLLSLLLRDPPMMVVELVELPTARENIYAPSVLSVRAFSPSKMNKPAMVGVKKAKKNRKQRIYSSISDTPSEEQITAKYKGQAPRKLSRPSLLLSAIELPKKEKKMNVFWKFITFRRKKKLVARPMYRGDVFYEGDTSRIMFKNQIKPKDYLLSVIQTPSRRDILQQTEGLCVCCPEAIKRPLAEMLRFELLGNFIYLLLLGATLCYYIAFFIPFLYLKRTYTTRGLEESEALALVPLMGLGVSCTRISIGFVFIAFPQIRPIYVAMSGMMLAGIIYMCMALYVNNIFLFILSFLLGLTGGLFIPLRSVLIVDYLGLKNLTKAMGFVFFIQGLGSLFGVPFAELLKGFYGTVLCMNYVGGSSFFLGGIFFACIRITVLRRETKKRLRHQTKL